MLYIFLVDSGTMMTFDMNLALESVAHLKSAIAAQSKIPEDKQVLLISGGESLDPNERVCSYSCAGTDTSPIFLFSKSAIESPQPPTCVVNYGPNPDMRERVESCIDMNPNYNTVVVRAEMAQQLHETATQQLHVCERLVHDQHLQQQGWAAVVANLEDITQAFAATANQLEENFEQFLQNNESYHQLLDDFKQDLELLNRIPVLPALINCQTTDNGSSRESMTLSQWLSKQDNQSSLEQEAQLCLVGLKKFDRNLLDNIKEKVKQVLESSNDNTMKEIKGLEDRLFGLEKLMCEGKRCVEEQKDLAQAFYHNQNRASNLKDASILHDLCESHKLQLQVMLKNHQKLRDIRRKCAGSKEEFTLNLYQRLRWVMHIEKELTEIDSEVLICRENLRRLKRHLAMVNQIHMAPRIYLSSIVEIVRRKLFSSDFQKWAFDLSKKSFELHQNEVEIRKNFSRQLSNHFLQMLFPGTSDLPPSFATEAPAVFDNKLPNINLDDIDYLRKELPDLVEFLTVPCSVPMPMTEPSINNQETKPFASVGIQFPEEIKSEVDSPAKLKPVDSDVEEFETVNNELPEADTKPSSTADEKAQKDAGIQTSITETSRSQTPICSVTKDGECLTEELFIESLEKDKNKNVSTNTSLDLQHLFELQQKVEELQLKINEQCNELQEKELEVKKLQCKVKEVESYPRTSTLGQMDRVAVRSCDVGDIVIVYYEEKFESFMVYILNPTLHFLHTDSVKNLSLRLDSGEPRKRFILAEVSDKEFCQARKPQNRFRVPVDTKFYRIKAKEWAIFSSLTRRDSERSLHKQQSLASASTSDSVITSQVTQTSNIYLSHVQLDASTASNPAHTDTLSQSCVPTFSDIFKK